MLKNIFKKNDKVEVNPFTKPNIYDRNIEKGNQCRQCKTYFGSEYQNVQLLDGAVDCIPVKIITCNICNEVHYFKNWE